MYAKAHQEFEKGFKERNKIRKENQKELMKWLDWAFADPDVKKIEVKIKNEYRTIYERKK